MSNELALSIVSTFTIAVLPVTWYVKAILLSITVVIIVYIALKAVSIKELHGGYQDIVVLALIICMGPLNFYAIYDQWIKDHTVQQVKQLCLSWLPDHAEPF